MKKNRIITQCRHGLPGIIAVALLLPCSTVAAPTDTSATQGSNPVPWEFSMAGYWYSFPSDDDLVMAVARANHGSLHLESRYNYEAKRTLSIFGGLNISVGEEFTLEATPMTGFAIGDTKGIIPALELSLGYHAFDFYAEGEYLFDLNDKSGNFAYTWLELAATPAEPIRAGLVAQRTRAFQSPLDLDRGIFAQVKPSFGTVSLYYFNPFTDNYFLTIGLEIAR